MNRAPEIFEWATGALTNPLPLPDSICGEYASSSIAAETRTIDVYANRPVEQAL